MKKGPVKKAFSVVKVLENCIEYLIFEKKKYDKVEKVKS